MQVRFREQLTQLLQERKLPLTCALIGVHSGIFASILMSQGMKLLYLVDEWTDSLNTDSGNMHEYYDNQLLQVQDKMSIYDNRTEKYIILQGTSKDIAPHIYDNSISMVYIDQQQTLTIDMDEWYPKLIDGGIMAIANYNDIQEELTLWMGINNIISPIVVIPEYNTNAGAYFIK